jgi:pimeloyl-ACP methyl ester carboxylesterase
VRPTIVLVHGAFAESSSWDGVIDRLLAKSDLRVVAAANPLRGLASDAAAVSDLVRSIEGPVVLVAHSYGGAVISNVDPDAGEIAGLVYVNAFVPEPGENCVQLAARFPGSMLRGDTTRAVPRRDGTTDLSIAPESFHDVFCQDMPPAPAALMCATQRPVTQEALVEPSGEDPLWESVPSWFLMGEEDRIIPIDLQRFMAGRAYTHAQRVVALEHASHALAVSHPDAVVHPIFEAAAMRVAV